MSKKSVRPRPLRSEFPVEGRTRVELVVLVVEANTLAVTMKQSLPYTRRILLVSLFTLVHTNGQTAE